MTNSRDGSASILTNSALVSALDSLITLHVENKTNPHDVTAGQVGAYTKSESNGKFVVQERLINEHPLDADVVLTAEDVGAASIEDIDGLVPATRTINSLPLTNDVVLTSSDVGAADETHKHPIADVNGLSDSLDLKADIDYVDATFALKTHGHSDLVPDTRSVNGHPLNSDITLSNSDIGLDKVKNWDVSDDAAQGTASTYASGSAAKEAYDRGTEGITTANEALDKVNEISGTLSGTIQHLGKIDLSGGTYPEEPEFSSMWYVEVGGTVNQPDLTFYTPGAEEEGGPIAYEPGDTLAYSSDLELFYRITDREGISRDEAEAAFLAIDGTAEDSALLGGDTKAEIIDSAKSDRVPVTRTVNSKPLSVNISLTAEDVGAADVSDLDDYVPITRTVNSKPLNADITLSKGDVGLSKVVNAELSSEVNDDSDNVYASTNAAKKAYDRGSSALNKANAVEASLDSHTDKKDNPHSVTAGQVGAYTKTESDGRYLRTGGDVSFNSVTVVNPDTDSPLIDATFSFDEETSKFMLSIGELSHVLMDEHGNMETEGDTYARSDVAVKDSMTPIPDALNIVLGWTGYSYFRTDLGKWEIGLSAQDVEKKAPLLVKRDRDGLLGLSYGKSIAYLVEALKQMSAVAFNQSKDIEHLKGEIVKLASGK